MLWSSVQHQRSPDVDTVFTLGTRTNDVLDRLPNIGRDGDSLGHREAAIAMDELLMAVAEGIALLANLHGLENAAVAKLLQGVNAVEEARPLLIVGLHTADVFPLGSLQNRKQVLQLLLELAADSSAHCRRGQRREERRDERRGGGGNQLISTQVSEERQRNK